MQLNKYRLEESVNKNNDISAEYICLCCNQLFTSKDIFAHLQQNKDHLDHCYHISNFQNQLSDVYIDNKEKNNDNIFKNRIETLWSSLKRLSTTHSSYNSKINEISNYFKLFYDYLINKEYSLKKQIQDDIDSINNDIIYQFNELKSIINIANINNQSEDRYIEVTTDKYDTISSIIESILESKSYSNFIENNKNTFSHNNKKYINNNQLLSYIQNHNRIFNLVQPKLESININENQYIVKVKLDNVCDQLQKIIKQSIVIDIIPSSLIRYGDLKRIKHYYKSNSINKLEYNHNSISKQQTEIKDTIIEILKSNRFDILEYLFQELHFDLGTQFKPDIKLFRSIDNIDFLAMATIYSNFETIQFIESFGIDNNIKWRYEICLELSPFSHNIEILQYFSNKVIGISDLETINNIFVSFNAALLGDIDMIKWISGYTSFVFKYVFKDDIFCINVAAEYGHLEIIKWLHENRTEGCTTNAMDYAAKNGHFEIIKWLHYNRTEGCTINAMDYTARNGHLEIIKWLHHNRTEGCTTWAMDYAAKNGHLETIKWLHHNRTEGCTIDAMDYAAWYGHLETIKWLHHNRTEGCTTKAMDNAAWNGHLETIKWLHHNRTEGCTTKIMDYAAWDGHLETIKWLHHNRTEGCTVWAFNFAARNGHLETIKWLHHNRTEGCNTYAMDVAARDGHLETIKWLHHNRTEGCTTKAMDYAARNGHLEVIKWLHHNRTEGCTTWAMDYAAKNGHLEIIKWLHHNRTECCITDATKTKEYFLDNDINEKKSDSEMLFQPNTFPIIEENSNIVKTDHRNNNTSNSDKNSMVKYGVSEITIQNSTLDSNESGADIFIILKKIISQQQTLISKEQEIDYIFLKLIDMCLDIKNQKLSPIFKELQSLKILFNQILQHVKYLYSNNNNNDDHDHDHNRIMVSDYNDFDDKDIIDSIIESKSFFQFLIDNNNVFNTNFHTTDDIRNFNNNINVNQYFEQYSRKINDHLHQYTIIKDDVKLISDIKSILIENIKINQTNINLYNLESSLFDTIFPQSQTKPDQQLIIAPTETNHIIQPYIFSTQLNSGGKGATLFNISNINDNDNENNELSHQLVNFNYNNNNTCYSMIAIDSYIYVFGGSNYQIQNKGNSKYCIYSMKTLAMDYQGEFNNGVIGGSCISACYDGNDYIYLVSGYNDMRMVFQKRIDRFNIRTRQFELFSRFYGVENYYMSFYYRNQIYSIPDNDNRIYCFDVETKTITSHTDDLLCRQTFAACTDGNGKIYCLSLDRFIRYNLDTRQVEELKSNGRPIKDLIQYSMVYHHNENNDIGDQIFLFGGVSYGNFIYSVKDSTWTQFFKDDKFSRTYFGAAIVTF